MQRIILFCLIFPVAGFADDPFACVDDEFAAAFLGTGFQNRPVYSTELPDAFRDLRVPDTFELVGSETNAFSLRAVYKTTENADSSLTTALDLLTKSGWRDLANIMAMHQRGFQTGMIPKTTQVCRDTEPGLLSITVNESTGQTYLSFSMANYAQGQTCDALEARTSPLAGRGTNFWKFLPVLELPDATQSSGAGMGGGGNEYHSDVIVNTEMSRASLMSYLGDQIRDQGWVLDTSWSGNLSSGSVWSRKSPQDEMLIGTLHAYGKLASTYHVRFGVSPAATGSFAGATRITNQAIRPN